MSRCIAFLSDYGHRDPCVGTCHAVIRRVDASIPIIDLSHGIERYDIRAGAIALADGVAYLPKGAVVLAVVDPGVGGERRAVAIDALDGFTFVGPDNGLLAPAVSVAGGAERVVELSQSPWRIEPVSSTFHGRDIFAPVAARLAIGGALSDSGQPLDPQVLISLDMPQPVVGELTVTAEAIDVDQYGNVRLAAATAEMQAAGIEPGRQVEIETAGLRSPARYAQTFDDAVILEPLVFEDSNGSLAIAVNRGSAASELGIKRGSAVRIMAL